MKKHLGSWVEGQYCEVTACWCKNGGRHEGTLIAGTLYCNKYHCWCHHAAPWHETMQKAEKAVNSQELEDMLRFFTEEE